MFGPAAHQLVDLWILQIMLAGTQAATVGLYLAALNIARVPGFALRRRRRAAAVESQANVLNDRRSSSAMSTRHCASSS
jgi:hypothetical protein